MISFFNSCCLKKKLLLQALYHTSAIVLFISSDGHFIPDHSVHTGYINVSRSDRDCSVTAYFSPASEAFGFSGYNVQLISNNDVITEKKNLPFTCEVSSTRKFLLTQR